MKTLLITGGCGYIGSHTIIEILKNPLYNVIIVDNFSNSNHIIIDLLNKITNKTIKLFEKDCRDNLDDIFTLHKISSIVHFAAYKSVGESLKNPLEYYDNNLNSLLNILKYAKNFNVENIVFSSSCSLYGNLKELPANENSVLSEPESPYAYTKLICEKILQDFSKTQPNIKIISLRYFNPVGAHESGMIGELPLNKPNNIVPVICNSTTENNKLTIFGNDYNTRDGTCIRDYVHVSDIGNAHLLAVDYLFNKSQKSYDTYNLGFGNNGISVYEIINAFERINDVKVNYTFGNRRDGDVIEIYSDSSKALKDLNWQPLKNINDMVSSAWKWYKNISNVNI
jgi:UDP-glucose 4-epimerase